MTGQYRVTEKVGNDYYRPSTYMSFDQYMAFKSKQQDKEYMKSLAGISSGKRNLSGLVDPVSKIDIKRNLVDRLFGGLGIQIEPRGNIDMTVGGFIILPISPIFQSDKDGRPGLILIWIFKWKLQETLVIS